MSLAISTRLAELGHVLPAAAAPAARYRATVRVGDLLFVSGQISEIDGEPAFIGRLGEGLGVAEGVRAAESAALGLLAQIAASVGDRVSAVRQVVRLGVFVAAAPGFTEASAVANGASALIEAVFGDAVGGHARAAIGVATLPAGVAVEVDAILQLAEPG